MADTGAPFELPFAEPSSFARLAPADFQALAEKVAEYFLFTESRIISASGTLQMSDTSRVVHVNASSAATLTVPDASTVDFPVGAVVGVYRSGEGVLTLVGASGVNVRNAGVVDRFREVSLRKRAANEWIVAGL